jgi:hypothetical protein
MIANLPADLVSKTTSWLDLVDRGLSKIEDLAAEVDPDERVTVTSATEDARATTRHLRAVLSSETALDSRPDTRWVPLSRPSPKFAALAHRTVNEVAATPFDLIVWVNTCLPEPTRGRFLILVGDVVGGIFTNLARGLWASFPEFAPAGWADAAQPDSELTEFLIRRSDEGEWFDLKFGEMPTVFRQLSVPSEVIAGFGELRLKIGEVEVSFTFEDPGIQVGFHGKIDPVLARRLIDEMAGRLAQYTGQSARVVEI